MWQKWVSILAGLWVIISPFILSSADTLKWSNVIFGIVIVVLVWMQGGTMASK